MVENTEAATTVVVAQYNKDGQVITGDMYAADDADEVIWFVADGTVWLSVRRTPRDRWELDTSDYVQILRSHYRLRFPTARDALAWAINRVDDTIEEAEAFTW